MRFLLLSDIHANSTALAAALDAAEGRWESVACLGDLVDYGPDPNEATERVRALNPSIIRGNHDKAVTGLTDLKDFNSVAQIAAQWTKNQLTVQNLKYLADLPAGPLTIDGLTL